MKSDRLYCSFCGKSQHEVGKLIAGPGIVFICNECVDMCHDIVHPAGSLPAPAPTPVPTLPPLDKVDNWHRLAEIAELTIVELRESLEGMEREAGWAEAVATPDEDVGYVFTPLTAASTGLPVDIAIGDDVPLVIASSTAALPGHYNTILNSEVAAAVRHWVVRHRVVLNEHWRDVIGTVDLIKRLQED